MNKSVVSKKNIEELIHYYTYLARTNPTVASEYIAIVNKLKEGDYTCIQD
jgi:repressor of nif and glnA expression